MIEWSFDLPDRRMYSAKYVASLLPHATDNYTVKTVLCRTDTSELASTADNLSESKTLEIAKSARAALDTYLAKHSE
jgi:hypothetical protein